VTKDLNHKAETAELIAQNKQQLKEIEFLNKLIANLTNEVSEQRNLTKEIAKASSKAQINQSFTKD
jgi:dynactin complex subunit